MILNDSEKTWTFRQEIRNWLKENLPEDWGRPDYVAPEPFTKEAHELGKWWNKKLYDAGYAGFGYPREYGGIKRTPEEIAIIREEMARYASVAGEEIVSIGLNLTVPTLMKHGQEWQKKRFIPKILSGEESWVQGFSEPDAGSDLANIQTTAVRDGDEWVVNGQKIWSSLAHFADFGLLVVKTDLEAPRHRNLSYFIFDCKSPGFSYRPLRQMTGGSEFCEMFFNDMRIPHRNLVGELNKGWYVALSTLGVERLAISTTGMGFAGGLDSIVELAKNTRRYGKIVWEDQVFRHKIAQVAIENQAVKYNAARAVAKLQKGIIPGFEASSIPKIFKSELQQRQLELAMEILGSYSQLVKNSRRAIKNGQWVFSMLWSRAETLGGGTSEINRNIIAERILGLPR